MSFIYRSRKLGFSIEEIRALFRLAEGGTACRDVKAVVLDHIDAVHAKIADLKKLELTLVELASLCDGSETTTCPIIDRLLQS